MACDAAVNLRNLLLAAERERDEARANMQKIIAAVHMFLSGSAPADCGALFLHKDITELSAAIDAARAPRFTCGYIDEGGVGYPCTNPVNFGERCSYHTPEVGAPRKEGACD